MFFLKESLIKEFSFRTSRSGGKGGQNVNKVSSKVELYWCVAQSNVFNEIEKNMILSELANRITNDGILQIFAEEDRSQLRNKEIAIKKILTLITHSLHIKILRKASKPNKTAIAKRLNNKRLVALKKISRKLNLD